MSEIALSNRVAVIVTALDLETRAVLRQLGKTTVETVEGTGFFKGQFEGWTVVVVESGAGNVSAATISMRALAHYKPSVALFVGIAGGVKDVAIGDVVVATKVYGYESGKERASGFSARPDVMKSAHALESKARVLRQSDEWRRRLDPAITLGNPAIFVGPIAAGEKVIASKRAATARLLKKNYGDTYAVEMEGRGFLEGVHVNHPTQGCVVRGISDLLSGKAGADESGSQPRAADAASAVAFEILNVLDGSPPTKVAPKFVETAATFSASVYFKKGETLAQVGVPNVDQVTFSFVSEPEAFLRIIPMQAKERPIPFATLNEVAGQAELLRSTEFGGLTFVNRYGAVLFAPDNSYRGGSAPLHWATQLFQNGELWCVTDSILIRKRGWRPEWVPIPLIPATVFEQAFYRTLHKNIAFAVEHLGLAFPCIVELGLVGVAGAHIALYNTDVRGPLQHDAAIVRKQLASASATEINAALLEFFEEVYDKTGYVRPTGLHGFPPGPPRA